MNFTIQIALALLLLGALYILLARRYPVSQMWAAVGLIGLLAIVVLDAFGHWPFFEWGIREALMLIRGHAGD